MTYDRDVENLIKEWKARADAESDDVSRFVFLYFCFNAAIAHESNLWADKRQIEWLQAAPDGSPLMDAFKLASRSDGFRRVLENLKSLGPIHDARPGPPRPVELDDMDDAYQVATFIYMVRCNLFHGRKRAGESRSAKLIGASADTLLKWVGNLVALLRERRQR